MKMYMRFISLRKEELPALSFRIALGTLIIKEKLRISDRETVEQIKENLHFTILSIIYSAAVANSVLPAVRFLVKELNKIFPIALIKLPSNSLNIFMFITKAAFASSTILSAVA